MNVKNIRIKFNEFFYSVELQNVNIAEGNYSTLYMMYQHYKKYNRGIMSCILSLKTLLKIKLYMLWVPLNPENRNIIINIGIQIALNHFTDNNI